MSQKYNLGNGKKARNYGSKGGGMKRHALSGHAHNHANSIARVREYNREQEALQALRKPQKMFDNVKDVFKKN